MPENALKVGTFGPNRVTGTVLRANAPGVAYPTRADGAGAFAFSLTDYWNLGYIGEDGVTKSESTSFSAIKEMGGKTVARFQTDYNASFSETLLEFNQYVAKILYGADNVDVIPADGSHGEIIVASAGKSPQVALPWILQVVGRSNQRRMYSIPLGMLTTVGDVTHQVSSAAGHQITIETLPDDQGYDFYLFDDDGQIGAVTAVPTITSITPSGKGTGQTVIIKGSRFMASGAPIVTGAAGVKVNGTNATDYVVLDTNTIAAVLPSGSAATVPVIVTNSTGASSGFSYARAA